jgi:AraC-like DNA-binding protein
MTHHGRDRGCRHRLCAHHQRARAWRITLLWQHRVSRHWPTAIALSRRGGDLAFRRGVSSNISHYDPLQRHPKQSPFAIGPFMRTSGLSAPFEAAAAGAGVPMHGVLSPAMPLSLARLVALVAEQRGITKAELLAQAGLPPMLLDRAHGEVYGIEFAALCLTAMRLTRDPCLGIEFGLNLPPSMLGMLGNALLSACSMADAIELAVNYWRLNGWYFELSMRRSDQELRIRATERFPLGPLRRFATESMMSAWIHAGRLLSGNLPPPPGVQLRFTMPREAAFARYASRLPDAQFGCDVDELVLPLHALDVPLVMGHPEAARQTRASCETALHSLSAQSGNLVQQVADALAPTTEGYPTMSQVAQRLGVTVRTMARHLDRQGLTFRQVVDERRHQEACTMLRDGRQTVDGIAVHLGYSDPANFSRAFRRWAGCTPSQYRDQFR